MENIGVLRDSKANWVYKACVESVKVGGEGGGIRSRGEELVWMLIPRRANRCDLYADQLSFWSSRHTRTHMIYSRPSQSSTTLFGLKGHLNSKLLSQLFSFCAPVNSSPTSHPLFEGASTSPSATLVSPFASAVLLDDAMGIA